MDSGHLDRVYGDDYFFGGGAGYRDYLRDQNTLVETGQRYGKILAECLPRHAKELPKSLLDIGAAAGFVLEGFRRSGWIGKGLEPNGTMVEYANDHFESQCTQGSLETIESDEIFDAISMIQVLPHFYDLTAALSNADRMTKPGGLWLIELWDIESITAKVLGKHWHEYNPPSVLHWFSEKSIEQLAAKHGMSKIARGRPKKRISGSHLKSAVKHNFSGGFVGAVVNSLSRIVPDAMTVPYPGDDVFWVILQKQQ